MVGSLWKWRPWLRAETVIFLLIWLLLMAVGSSRFFRDPGTFWHTVVGERILSTGQFIRTDPFSCTFQGQPWIARHWLVECSMALLHRLSGLDGLLLGTVTLLAVLYTWVAHRLVRAGMHGLLACFFVLLAMVASEYHFHPRPHLVTIALLGWTFARLCDFEAGRIPLRGLLWLPPVFLVWVNAHDGMLGGLGTLVVVVLGWMVFALIGWNAPKRKDEGERMKDESDSSFPVHPSSFILHPSSFLYLAGIVAACALTMLINPFGLDVPRTWIALLRSPVLPQVMAEHRSLLSSSVGWTVLLFGGVYLSCLLGSFPCRPRVVWLFPLVWFILAWTRIRHGPLFAVVAVLALADMYPHIRWVQWLARQGSVVFRLGSPGQTARLDWRSAFIPATLVLAAVVCQAAAVPVPIIGRGWVQLDRDLWPVELVEDQSSQPRLQTGPEVLQAGAPGIPIFNEDCFGGFLIYYTPRLRVYIDDRCELYGDKFILDYIRAPQANPPQVESLPQISRCQVALTKPGSNFDRYFSTSDGWEPVRQTPAANLYKRRGSPGEGIVGVK